MVFFCGYRVSPKSGLTEYVIFYGLSSISKCVHTEYWQLLCVIEYPSKRYRVSQIFWDYRVCSCYKLTEYLTYLELSSMFFTKSYRVSNFLSVLSSIYTIWLSSMEIFWGYRVSLGNKSIEYLSNKSIEYLIKHKLTEFVFQDWLTEYVSHHWAIEYGILWGYRVSP